ncbi:XXYS1_4_G0029180.mRNA.1.CDS.1 [Saccharomyces cerevisiae]|nr:EM14S01-3B_G0026660.mRNA.1.CDS.1 [Saccharomyces cerevisiae]CAD6646959.1 XXYS1_4_G0029180.mRNA.1.CDS.1 [Saccharomyces cerevisiae]CAI4767834.1 CEI_1a_G0048410.mRNA.1.CDS.1 [Saccharomyces cerevisiae]CAI4774038.1 AMH_1a_G0048520.mRNA.1.CDS.1 [Saccharomyces cerevisiae]CAI6875130.1 AMH_1a_G0048520.mRNA.1.CDS.1 [Saccharomyces cerevisiae]
MTEVVGFWESVSDEESEDKDCMEVQNTVSADESPLVQSLVSFVGSCSINLLLPFLNGMMLGFGELFAHELCWRFNWFNHRNKGYKVYPESRKIAALKEISSPGTRGRVASKFL